MKKARRSQHGLSLVITLLVVAMIAVVAFGAASVSQSLLSMTDGASDASAAKYAAEAGLGDALSQLKANPAWATGFASKPLPTMSDITYTVTVANNATGSVPMTASDGTSVPPGDVYLLSVGQNGPTTRSAKCLCRPVGGASASVFNYALFGVTSLSVTGGAEVDGYDSEKGPYGSSNDSESASVGSDDKVETAGGIDIPGDVTSCGTITSQGQLNVKGNVESNDDIELGANGTITGNISCCKGNVTIDNSVKVGGDVRAGGDDISNNAPTVGGNVIAKGAVSWSTGTIGQSVEAGSTIALRNTQVNGNICAAGAISTASSSVVEGNASSLTSITFTNPADVVHGLTTAPAITNCNGRSETSGQGHEDDSEDSSGQPRNCQGGTSFTTPSIVIPEAPEAVPTVSEPLIDCTYNPSNCNQTGISVSNWGWNSTKTLSSLLDGSHNLNVEDGETLDLAPGTYYFNNVTVTNGNLNVLASNTGPVTLYLTGNLTVTSAGNVNNATQVPANMRIISSNTSAEAMELGGSSDMYAALYCPEGTVTLGQGGDLYGSAVGGTLISSGGCHVHYDTALKNLQLSTGGTATTVTVLMWQR